MSHENIRPAGWLAVRLAGWLAWCPAGWLAWCVCVCVLTGAVLCRAAVGKIVI